MEQGRIGTVSRHVWSVAHRSHESQDECTQGCLSWQCHAVAPSHGCSSTLPVGLPVPPQCALCLIRHTPGVGRKNFRSQTVLCLKMDFQLYLGKTVMISVPQDPSPAPKHGNRFQLRWGLCWVTGARPKFKYFFETFGLDLSELNLQSTGVMKQQIELPVVEGFLLH